MSLAAIFFVRRATLAKPSFAPDITETAASREVHSPSEALITYAAAPVMSATYVAEELMEEEMEIPAADAEELTLEQLKDCLGVFDNLEMSPEEVAAIDEAAKGGLVDSRPIKG